MPVMRDKDGNIVEEPTQTATPSVADDATYRVPAPGAAVAAGSDTRRVGDISWASMEDPKTRIYRGQVTGSGRAIEAVAGWLVVIEGPGRGQIYEVGYGVNSVGRGPGNRVRLDFGDNQISSDDQCVVTFDPDDGAFYVAGGRGVNITKHNGRLLSAAHAPLADRDEIRFGETALMFVALCTSSFRW